MSNSFNISRFRKYLAFDLKSRWKDQRLFLITFAILPMIFHLIYLFFAALGHDGIAALFSGIPISRPPLGFRLAIFAAAAGLFLMIFPSRTYGFLTEKAPGADWIELPASRLEKFVSMMLVCLVIIPAVFFCGYLVSDVLVCLVDKHTGSSILGAWLRFDNDGITNGGVKLGAKGLWFLASGVLQTVSVFLLGALLFKKGKIAKTILALFVISMALSALAAATASSIDIPSILESLAKWTESHMDHFDFWFNFLANLYLIIIVGGLGLWSWFKVKKLQH
ncbi:MAG: hypothetical protein IJ840_10070 [Bacteroidales bacterium]|nr:hypothetical protein [Bacteroidales bacterium]